VQQEVEKAALTCCQYALAVDGEVVVSETLGSAPSDAPIYYGLSSQTMLRQMLEHFRRHGV
jgi:hypothetical protein